MDFHANMTRTICQKLSAPSPDREGDVAQQGNQQYEPVIIAIF